MQTPSHRYASVLSLLALFHSLPIHAIGLPHEVVNVTQPIGVPQAISMTATEPVTINYATTELFTTTQQCPTSTIPSTIYSIVFPSPDAAPIEITAQSHVITSFAPEMTWCVSPPVQFVPISGAPFPNVTVNFMAIAAGTGSCKTVYAPVETTVCATTLTALASKVTITDCDQEVTFSTECGFSLETPTPTSTMNGSSLITPAPTVRRLFTFYLAPWQSMTAGEIPSDVDVKICKVLDSGDLECSRYQEIWEIVMVTTTLTTTHPIAFTATLSGPGTLMVATLQAIVTDTIVTVDLSMTLLLETEIEAESISTRRRTTEDSTSTITASTSTNYLTKTVHRVRRCVN